MNRIVVDTHAAVWHLTAPPRLGKRARRLLEQADEGSIVAHVPVIALVEISLLHERGRLRFGADRMVELLARHRGWEILALDIEQGLCFATLAAVRDPMDRLVASAARALGCPLVSADETFDAIHGLDRAWD
jgi:PIN domain nuclease of toxin-antitoxin system